MFKIVFTIYFLTFLSLGSAKYSQSELFSNFFFSTALTTSNPLHNQELNQPKISTIINENLLQTPVQESIKKEVEHTYRRIKPVFDTWLIIIIMLSALPVGAVLLLLGKLARETDIYSQGIDRLKYETISQVNYISSDAKNVLIEIQDKLKNTQEKKPIFDPNDLYSPDEILESESNTDAG